MTALQDKLFRQIQQLEQELHGPVPARQILGGRYHVDHVSALAALKAAGRIVTSWSAHGDSAYSTVIAPSDPFAGLDSPAGFYVHGGEVGR